MSRPLSNWLILREDARRERVLGKSGISSRFSSLFSFFTLCPSSCALPRTFFMINNKHARKHRRTSALWRSQFSMLRRWYRIPFYEDFDGLPFARWAPVSSLISVGISPEIEYTNTRKMSRIAINRIITPPPLPDSIHFDERLSRGVASKWFQTILWVILLPTDKNVVQRRSLVCTPLSLTSFDRPCPSPRTIHSLRTVTHRWHMLSI